MFLELAVPEDLDGQVALHHGGEEAAIVAGSHDHLALLQQAHRGFTGLPPVDIVDALQPGEGQVQAAAGTEQTVEFFPGNPVGE